MKSLRFALLPLVLLAACGPAEGPGPDGETVDDTALGASTGQRYIVKFKDSQGKAELVKTGASIARDLPAHAAAAALIPAAAVSGLKSNPHIEYVELDPQRRMDAQTTPYGIPMVQATDPAFSKASTANRTVCIIDSGLYTGHEDLAGLSVSGEEGTEWSVDGCGHGTHVAGTIAAVSNNKGVVGVAPGVALHIVRVFGDDCSWIYASDLVPAVDECRNAGANVISMSLGGDIPSHFEEVAFDASYAAGVLAVAAAGNGGSQKPHYPASYGSVVSVAALDKNQVVASFSQKNQGVELAAPGVQVLSTVPWITTNTLTVGNAVYTGGGIEGAASGSVTGALVDGGLCDAPGAWSGKVVLCQRGSISFFEKVMNVQSGGGAAAVIYNNVSGGFAGTLGDGNTSAIPAISLSMEDGTALVAGSLGQSGTVSSTTQKPASGYEAWDGTSMATPHVSGVAALVWSFNPAWTNVQIRSALTGTAKDLGAPGRDTSYGFGLVQAKAALDSLKGGACAKKPCP